MKKIFSLKGGKMTTKKFFLTATLVATVFAFTVPVSFAACSTGGACPIESVQNVTPDTATCSKCKQTEDKCKCKKAKKRRNATHAKREQQPRATHARRQWMIATNAKKINVQNLAMTIAK